MSPLASRPASRGLFVTGTDTGVGKTLVSCALLRRCAAAGHSAIGMKPVAAGAERTGAGLRSDDVERLVAASTVPAPSALVNPYCFEPAVAPHVAAQDLGVSIDCDAIRDAYAGLAQRADRVVVEGVGGFRVPLGAHHDGADLAQRLALPVVLVVALRLGCLNHALLTARAIRECGLVLAGWVANCIDPAMARIDASIAALDERLEAPRIATLPLLDAADRAPARVAALIAVDPFDRIA